MGADRHFNAGDFFRLKSLQLPADFLTIKIPLNFQCFVNVLLFQSQNSKNMNSYVLMELQLS